MLSRTSRQEIIRKLDAEVGHPVEEKELSQNTSQAITNLAVVQRHLFVIAEILGGERERIEGSALLSLKSRLRKDKEMETHAEEIRALQAEIHSKISEVSEQVLQEEKARKAGQPLPEREGGIEAVQLKCPTCGAALPMPTGRFVKCEYCNSTMSIQDLSSQIRTIIQSI
jgi:DNA-directed RNA polymerase subunit RPC12/RpoP